MANILLVRKHFKLGNKMMFEDFISYFWYVNIP